MNFTPDLYNGLAQFAAVGFLCKDVATLLHDKYIRGVYWPARIYIALWMWWIANYYYSTDQWWSAVSALGVAIVTTTWTALAAYYTWRNKYGKK